VEDTRENCMIARRINKWQWTVTFESANGLINTYENVSHSQVERWASDMVENDECTYIPHISTAV
jgi:hypothetical protein